ELPGDWATDGRRIRDAVRDALQHDELSQALPQVLDREDGKATRLLQEAAKKAAGPEPKPPRPQPPKPPTHRLPAHGSKDLTSEDAEDVLKELLERRAQIDKLSISWRLRE